MTDSERSLRAKKAWVAQRAKAAHAKHQAAGRKAAKRKDANAATAERTRVANKAAKTGGARRK